MATTNPEHKKVLSHDRSVDERSPVPAQPTPTIGSAPSVTVLVQSRENSVPMENPHTSVAIVAASRNNCNRNNQIRATIKEQSCLWYNWNRLIQSTYPVLLLLMVLVLWPAGWFALHRLLTKTDSTFHSPVPGSPSSAAQSAFRHKFPDALFGTSSSSGSPALLVVLHLTNTSAVSSLIDHVYARQSSLDLESYLNSKLFGPNVTTMTKNTSRYSAVPTPVGKQSTTPTTSTNYSSSSSIHSIRNSTSTGTGTRGSHVQVSSYYGFIQANLSLLAKPFLAKDEQTCFLQVVLQLEDDHDHDAPSRHNNKHYIQALMVAIDDYYYKQMESYSKESFPTKCSTTRHCPKLPPDDLEIGFTGLNYFSQDLRKSTQQDLKRMDAFVLPLALLLVGITLLRQKSSQALFLRHHHPTSSSPLTSSSSSSLPLSFLAENHRHSLDSILNTIQQMARLACFLPVLLLLPLCGMISTVATWSLWMDSVVVSRMQITQFTPSIMMSLTLGMGIDYTLFLVARYLEAKSEAVNTVTSRTTVMSASSSSSSFDAIQIMLEQGGQVVLVSGTTLLCTFLALVALPLPMLQSVGVGAAVAIASSILMNLLVIPALLYTRMLQNGLVSPHSPTDQESSANSSTSPRTNTSEATEPLLPSSSDDPTAQMPTETQSSTVRDGSMWVRLARQVLHPYKSVIIVLIILQFLLFPVAWNARRLDSSNLSFESLLPEDAPSLHTYHQLVDSGHFGRGKLAPFHILLDGTRSNTTMDTSHAFDLQHDLVQTLLMASNNKTSSVGATFLGISVANNQPVPYQLYLASKRCKSTTADASAIDSNASTFPSLQDCSNNALRCLHFLDQHMVSRDRYATYIAVELQFVSPFDQEAIAWLDETRKRIDEWMTTHQQQQISKVNVYLDGTAAVAHDAVQAVYSSFPRVIVSTLAIVFLLLGGVFRSIIPPLRSIVSISFTLTVSFGLAVLVYQDGIWNSWHIRSFMAIDPEISWLVPIMSFSIIVGLALDYDVFLVSRILEYRLLEGYGHESSIAAGLESTGAIITSAGIIMALSFGSLLSSQSPALDQFAFLLTVAVILDTFVVRTILVPAMMGWTGSKHSWWPRLLPTPTFRLDGFDVDGLDEGNDSDNDVDDHAGNGDVNVNVNCDKSEPRESIGEFFILEQDDAPVIPLARSQRRETLYYEAVERQDDLPTSP